MITAYAQTELAHGSDVQELMTTATFDEKTGEFVINTPCLEAYKWWPGDLGVVANWVFLFAQVIVKGEKKGVFPLFVQIRDMKTHKVLPGLEVGDIGPKFGYSSKDNGFMAFTNYRVPRKSLLGKYVSVGKNGDWKTRGNLKMLYAAMMFIRQVIIEYSGDGMAITSLIALRYSIVRSQFKHNKTEERKIIEYQLQKNKIYPILAKAFACTFASQKIGEVIQENYERASKNDFLLMKEGHILLCGSKAVYSQWHNDATIS